MLDAHYKGKINIEDYWSVGDTRTVQLTNIGSSGTQNHVDQLMTMVIIGFNHDDLTNKQETRNKAAITVQCREILGNNGTEESEYIWGSCYLPVQDEDTYIFNPLRTWLNNNFIDAMPITFNKLIKTVNKKNLKYHSKIDGAPVNSEDKAFLLSYPEIFGSVKNILYVKFLEDGEAEKYEGMQYKYFETTANRIKYSNNNGNKSSSSKQWWLRSPSSAEARY